MTPGAGSRGPVDTGQVGKALRVGTHACGGASATDTLVAEATGPVGMLVVVDPCTWLTGTARSA